MKYLRHNFLISLMCLLFIYSCNLNKVKSEIIRNLAPCSIILFSQPELRGSYIIVDGPSEYANIDNLPNVSKKWTGIVRSCTVGDSAILITWKNTNFQGDSIVYEYKNKFSRPVMRETVRSMKIVCK